MPITSLNLQALYHLETQPEEVRQHHMQESTSPMTSKYIERFTWKRGSVCLSVTFSRGFSANDCYELAINTSYHH